MSGMGCGKIEVVMEEPYKQIIQLLNEHGIIYQEIEHEPVFTSEQAAAVRGFNLHQGAKSLVLKTPDEFIAKQETVRFSKQSFILVIIPGDKRLDSGKMREILGVRKLRFASPEEVKEVMGCEIGACYPFGEVAGIKMFVDKSLGENEEIGFNPGVHDKSIKMRYKDYEKITSPEIIDVSNKLLNLHP
jgi:Ala-tRNA(Pro) deacylase